MGDVAEHHAAHDPVEDQTDVSAGTGRPEVFGIDVVEMMALQAWIVRVDLHFEGGDFGGRLLFDAELVETGLEAVGEEKRHDLRTATN